MKTHLLTSAICTAMMRVGTRMATTFDQQFGELGVTQAQFRTLLAVRYSSGPEGITPSELADHLLLERPTVTVLVTRLVERGLLGRQPGANRRSYRLALTPTGEALLDRVVPRAIALAEELLVGFSPEQLERIWEALQAIEARVRAYETQDTDTAPPTSL